MEHDQRTARPQPMSPQDPNVARQFAAGQASWDLGLSARGVTGDAVGDDGTRHVAQRELHPDEHSRLYYWCWSCSCGATGRYHYGSPFADVAYNAAVEWADHLPPAR